MELLEKIKQMSDNEIVGVYQNFSVFLSNEIDRDNDEILEHIPDELCKDKTISMIQQTDIEKMDSLVKPEEVVPVVRMIMEQWAQDPEKSVVLQKFLETEQIHTMCAAEILAIGSVIVMPIIFSSLKIEYKEGQWYFRYDPSCISDKAIEMVKTVTAKLPETLKSVFINK